METLTAYHPGVEKFGERLRSVREALNLQQVQIGRRVKRDPKKAAQFGKYLSRLETGLEDNPSLEILEDIASGMGLRLSDFVLRLEGQTSTDKTNPDRSSIVRASEHGGPGHGVGTSVRSLEAFERIAALSQTTLESAAKALLEGAAEIRNARTQAPAARTRAAQPTRRTRTPRGSMAGGKS